MKRLLPIIMLFGSASSAFAGEGQEDGSGVLVWAFLGFSALIVVFQLIPALLLLFGIGKGITAKRPLVEKEAPSGSWGSE